MFMEKKISSLNHVKEHNLNEIKSLNDDIISMNQKNKEQKSLLVI